MKKIKTKINDSTAETYSLSNNLMKYAIKYPDKLDLIINQLNDDEKFALQVYFSEFGLLKPIKYLVEHGADINFERTNPFCIAAYRGHFDIVKYYVEKGVDIWADNYFILYTAASTGRLNILQYAVQYAIENGIPNEKYEEDDYEDGYEDDYEDSLSLLLSSVMNYAAMHGHFENVKYLLDHGAHANYADGEALIWAARHGDLKIVQCLVEHGANIHERNDKALYYASVEGYADVVEYLLKQGANMYADRYNDPLWDAATKNDNVEVIKLLVEHGGANRKSIKSAFDAAISGGHLNIVKYLAEQGLDIPAKGDEPVIDAELRGFDHVVKYLDEIRGKNQKG